MKFGCLFAVQIHKRLFFVALLTAVLAGQAAVCLGNSDQNATPNGDTLKGQKHSLFAGDPNFSLKPGNGAGSGELFFRMTISVVLVLILGAAALFLSKRLLPRIANLPGKRIRVIETAHLGPRRTVHLIKIDNHCILIGSTNEHIAKLADVGDSPTDVPEQYRAGD